MVLEPGRSEFARPEWRDSVLRRVLLRRNAELQRSWKQLISAECLKSLGPLGADVQAFLSEQDTARDWRPAAVISWVKCDLSFLESLGAIALAKKFEYWPSDVRPSSFSLGDFNKLSARERFDALSSRYRCPLNIGAPSEGEVAEELLRQLMVPDRAKLKAGSEYEVDWVLLKLILAGLRALMTHDLRFLDALSFFYELPCQSLTRMRANPPFLAFWLCIYSQLLRAADWEKCASP